MHYTKMHNICTIFTQNYCLKDNLVSVYKNILRKIHLKNVKFTYVPDNKTIRTENEVAIDNTPKKRKSVKYT